MPRMIIQNYRNGVIEQVELPIPSCRSSGVLVETACSTISPGTERTMTEIAKKSLLGKAIARPDLVRQFVNKARSEGIFEAYGLANQRLDTPIPLGYSLSGKVIAAGAAATGFFKGQRVAATGVGFANHAEVNYIPKTLCAPVPENVTDEQASFAGLGAISLHAVRTAGLTIGETAAVVGLGILGLLAVQMLRASGVRVVGFDIDPSKVKLAREMGAQAAFSTLEPGAYDGLRDLTAGRGADAVLVFAASEDKSVLEFAAEIAAERAKVVVPGLIPLEVPRKAFYEKELSLFIPRAGGPGLYDEAYESGLDYPVSHLRWSAGRNMEAFLNLVSSGDLRIDRLITHRISYDDALTFYAGLQGGTLSGPVMGVVMSYPGTAERAPSRVALETGEIPPAAGDRVGVGVIGSGLFTRSVLLPALAKLDGFAPAGIAALGGLMSFHTGRKFGFRYATSDYREILNDKSIHAVLITTRHDLHAAFIVEALGAGKHVFVEKPMTLTADELKEVTSAVAANPGSMLMVGFNRRFSSTTEFLRSKLGAVSEPLTVIIRVNAGYAPRKSWVHGPAGGGRLLGEVCHFIDLAQAITGSLPETVDCMSLKNSSYLPSDNVSLNIQMKNGSLASIVYVASGDRSWQRERVEVFGGGCAAEIDSFKTATVASHGRTHRKRLLTADMGYVREMEAFLTAIRAGGRPPVPYEDYLYTTAASIAAERSMEEGRVVPVSEVIGS